MTMNVRDDLQWLNEYEICENLSHIAPGSLILTANQHLAHWLQQSSTANADPHQIVRISSLQNWLTAIWQQNTSSPHLLNSYQEYLLWQDIIQKAPNRKALQSLTVGHGAKLAAQAWQLMQHWQIDENELDRYDKIETECFRQWSTTFKAKCSEANWISYAEMIKTITLHGELYFATAQTHQIYLYGFNLQYSPPLLKKLLAQLKNYFSIAAIQFFQPKNFIPQLYLAPNEKDELLTLAKWAISIKQQQPQAKVACVLPNLKSQRQSIVKAFITANHKAHHYEVDDLNISISSGVPLDEYSMLKCALDLLSFWHEPLPYDELLNLAANIFIRHDDQDLENACALDIYLRKHNHHYVSIDTLTKHISTQQHPKKLWQRWHDFFALRPDTDTSATPESWVSLINSALLAIGWPGGRACNPLEQGLYDRWQQLLADYQESALLFPQQNWLQTLRIVRELAHQTLFQPPAKTGQIAVVGQLEILDQSYDYLWVAQLSASHWPSFSEANPFLPLTLQRQYKVPQAHFATQQQFYLSVVNRLLTQAEHTVISAAATEHHVAQLHPQLQTLTTLQYQTVEASINHSSINEVETWFDDQGPPLTEDTHLQSGSHLFKWQSQCPFKAFAKIRLNATAPTPPTLGIGAAQHGELMHQALEIIWRQLKSQQQLLALTQTQLIDLIRNTCKAVIKPVTDSCFKQAELERLISQIYSYLELEKQRPSFKVLACEQRRRISFNQLTINVRIDRVDEIAPQRFLIIDYKTGATSNRDWLGERPLDPQMPLYATTQPNIVGLVFATIKTDQQHYRGLLAEQYGIKGCNTVNNITLEDEQRFTWPQLLEYWKNNLNVLAKDFIEGRADVNPIQPHLTCRHCDLHTFCRIAQDD